MAGAYGEIPLMIHVCHGPNAYIPLGFLSRESRRGERSWVLGVIYTVGSRLGIAVLPYPWRFSGLIRFVYNGLRGLSESPKQA